MTTVKPRPPRKQTHKNIVLHDYPLTADDEENIRLDCLDGSTPLAISRRRSLPYNAVRNLIYGKKQQWFMERRHSRIRPDETKIVIPRTFYVKGGSYTAPCSLPRVSMHVAALEGRV